jgi:hypothetical protein
MVQDHKLDLEAKIAAASARPRPVLNYDGMTLEEFVRVWFYGRFVEMFSVALVELGANQNWSVGREWQTISEVSGELTENVLFALADKYYEPALFWVLCERMYEQICVMEELAKRIEGKAIGTNLILIPAALRLHPDLSRVEKSLQVDKLTSFRERDYEADDLKQMALEKAVATINGGRGINRIPLPAYPVKLRPDIQSAWDTWMAEAWKQGMQNAFGEIKAGLTLDDETIIQKTREHIRNLWDTTTRRHDILQGKEGFPEDGSAACQAEWDWTRAAAHNRQEEIQTETVGEIPTPEDSVTERELGAEAYNYVKSRWGEQGRVFLDNLIASDGNVAAASKAAKVSRVTGTEWRNQIEIELSKKNPTK